MKSDYQLLYFVLTCQIISLIHCTNVKLNKCHGASLKPSMQQSIFISQDFMADGEATTFPLFEQGEALKCSKVAETVRFNEAGDIKFIDTGEVMIENSYYNIEDYCIQSFQTNIMEFTITYCPPDCGKSHICIPKCCRLNQAIDIPVSECNVTGLQHRNWVPDVYNEEEYTLCGKKELGLRPHFIHFSLPCSDFHFISAKMIYASDGELMTEAERFRLLRNGSLVINEDAGKWRFVDEGMFCIDAIQNYGPNFQEYNGDPNDRAIIICANETNSTLHDDLPVNQRRISLSSLYAYLMIFGAVFLFLTAVVYLLLWDKHNIHGWTIFCFDISMFFMFVFLASSHLTYEHLDSDDIGSVRCTAIGILAHYFFLASFSWMTVINVDLWWTFKNLSPTSGKTKGIQKFVLYMIFAWAIPLVIVVFSIIVDKELMWSKLDECDKHVPIVLPKYGQQSCYLSEKARGYYLYLPIALLLFCNTILFSSTVWTLWIYKQSTKQAVRGSSSNQKQSFIIFIKMFFVMGISWIFELISWYFTSSDGFNSIWIISDILNLLSPLAIFFIFVCKREIIVMLYHKYPFARGMLQLLSRLPCCKMGLVDTEATEMTGADKSRVLHHKRRSSSSVN